VRAFLAIDLPGELKKRLFLLKQEAGPGLKLKWVEEKNFHLTIKFLGDVEEKFLKKIYNELSSRTENFQPFKLEMEEVGFFGKKAMPRVVWFGIKESKPLEILVRELNRVFKKLGFPRERERFHPHITLFRVRYVDDVAGFEKYYQALRKDAEKLRGVSFEVKELVLFKSTLTSKGPIYEPLYKLEFSNGK